jgi:hypothetical protein
MPNSQYNFKVGGGGRGHYALGQRSPFRIYHSDYFFMAMKGLTGILKGEEL